MAKTVIFEEEYGIDIKDMKSTEDVDTVIEKRIGRKLKVVHVDMFPIKEYNIEKKLDEALKEKEDNV
jgi:hypothetical protein